MAQETWFTSDGEQHAGPIDLDEFSSQSMPYRSSRSVVGREDHYPDDPVPLFLSGFEEAPKPPAFGNVRNRAIKSRRPFRTGVMVTAAAAAAFAVLSARNPFPVFANATASLIGLSDGQPASVSPAPAVQATTSVQAAAQTPKEMPTRDEIALALRSAHQSLAPAEIRQSVAAVRRQRLLRRQRLHRRQPLLRRKEESAPTNSPR